MAKKWIFVFWLQQNALDGGEKSKKNDNLVKEEEVEGVERLLFLRVSPDEFFLDFVYYHKESKVKMIVIGLMMKLLKI